MSERISAESPLGQWLTGVTLLVAFALMARTKLPPYLVMLGGVTVLLVSGVLSTEQALAGFSNSGMITVAILFIVAAGMRQTGTLAYLLRRTLGRPKTAASAQIRLAVPVVTASAFMNNTPLVSMLLPVVQDWCRSARVPPTKVLLPLSFFAILGGLITLIGTSTNLVVDGMLVERGLPSTGMFGITPVGLPCAVAGCIVMIAFAQRLLPDVPVKSETKEAPREYTIEVRVQDKGALVGKLLAASGLMHLPGVTLTQRRRNGSWNEDLEPNEPLAAGDGLVFVGMLDSVLDLLRTPGVLPTTDQDKRLSVHPSNRCYVEAVVSRTSPLLARSVREIRFREVYGAVVLAVSRNGQRLLAPITDVDFRPGDALFLDAPVSFVDQRKNSGDFALVGRVSGEGPATSAQAPIAALIVLSMIGLAGFGVLSMLEASALAAAAMLLTRCCSQQTALQSIDWPLLLTIGAAFGFGSALEGTGLAEAIARNLLALAGDDPLVTLCIVCATTMLVTEFVTNNAAAALVLPIALATADNLGVNYVPFAIAVMTGASSSFLTPIGYQTNLMVYVAGGYRFTDFFRVGIPLSVVVVALTTALAPLVYGF